MVLKDEDLELALKDNRIDAGLKAFAQDIIDFGQELGEIEQMMEEFYDEEDKLK